MTDSRISRFLSLVLRHKPETIGIELDENGWCKIDHLILKSHSKGISMNSDVLDIIVKDNDKQRFAISPDGKSIRANQGHSVKVDLLLPEVEPPEYLYHGTPKKFLESILQEGLDKRQRHHVHLSEDRSTAKNVGDRRGESCILVIQARMMWDNGYKFYLSRNGVWLTDAVPRDFIWRVEDDS